MIKEIIEIVRVGLLQIFGMICLLTLIVTFGVAIIKVFSIMGDIVNDFFKTWGRFDE